MLLAKIASSPHACKGPNHLFPKDLRNAPADPDLTAML